MSPRTRGAIDASTISPVLRAYGLGYLAATAPLVIGRMPAIARENAGYQQKIKLLLRVLLRNFGLRKFPTSCAVLIGGSTWLPLLCNRLLYTCAKYLGNISLLSSRVTVRLVRFLSAFVSGWLAFQIINPSRAHRQEPNTRRQDVVTSDGAESNHERGHEQAGRTMDLTLFTGTRALCAVAYIAWEFWKSRRKLRGKWTEIEAMVPQIATAGIFAWSSAVVMWAWFYLPERLPRSYAKWITSAAEVDLRLIEALRRARRGEFVYGKDTGQAPLLGSMCADYGLPIEWGDPSKTVPMPCELIHMRCGPSCEWHAISRFLRGFRFALATYLPVQILLRLRSNRTPTALRQAVLGAARSSSFLALFIALFYYSVCLARTRLGPRLFDSKTVSPMKWDSGLCVGAGCVTCGWSILLETPRRREEIALFVLPRAIATFFPRRYDRKYLRREQTAFALSAAIILTCVQERPNMVRGVFGRILARVLGTNKKS